MTTPTVFDSVLDAVKAALTQGPALAGGNIFEGGDVAAVPEDCALALVYGITRVQVSSRFAGDTAPTVWQVLLKITAFCREAQKRGSLGRGQWALADDAHRRIMASTLAQDFEVMAATPDTEVAQTRMGAIDLFYEFEIVTPYNSLEARA